MACQSVQATPILRNPPPCSPKSGSSLLLFTTNRNHNDNKAFPILNRTITIGNTQQRLMLVRASSSPSNGNSSKVEKNKSHPEENITGVWPDNFSVLNYDDLRAFLEPRILKEKMDPSALLGMVMSSTVRTATVEQTLEEINHNFDVVSGLPVIDGQYKCIGVVSKKDKQRSSNGLLSKVGEVMSSPPMTLLPNKTVLDAAAVMLKEKIHRIPIVNEEGQVVGIVSRTDIFKAMEGLPV